MNCRHYLQHNILKQKTFYVGVRFDIRIFIIERIVYETSVNTDKNNGIVAIIFHKNISPFPFCYSWSKL